MPIRFTVDDKVRRVVARATGDVTLAEFLAFIEKARQPIERREWALLIDARGATTHVDAAALEAIVDRVKVIVAEEPFSRGNVALVADDDRMYSFFFNYETRLTDLGIRLVRVFRQLQDAEEWLTVMSSSSRFR